MIINVSFEHSVMNWSLFPVVAVAAGKSSFTIEECSKCKKLNKNNNPPLFMLGWKKNFIVADYLGPVYDFYKDIKDSVVVFFQLKYKNR